MSKLNVLEWKNIYYMLCYCVDELAYFEQSEIDYEEVNGTNDLLAALLCNAFNILYRNGYIKEYKKEQIITDKPMGSINVPKSITSGCLAKGKLTCLVSKLNIDNKYNRIIKAAFSILLNVNNISDDTINDGLLLQLSNYNQMLKKVKDIQISEETLIDIKEVPEWYKPSLVVCELIINSWLAFDKEGKHRLLELKDEQRLCYIWQKYLLEFCRREYSSYRVHNPIFGKGRHQWRTDLVIEDKDNKFAVIADAKWYETSSMSTSNIAQVNTYESKYIHAYPEYSTVGLVIYASSDKTEIFEPEMMDNGKTVTEVLININQDKELLEKDIKEIINKHLKNKKDT